MNFLGKQLVFSQLIMRPNFSDFFCHSCWGNEIFDLQLTVVLKLGFELIIISAIIMLLFLLSTMFSKECLISVVNLLFFVVLRFELIDCQIANSFMWVTCNGVYACELAR